MISRVIGLNAALHRGDGRAGVRRFARALTSIHNSPPLSSPANGELLAHSIFSFG